MEKDAEELKEVLDVVSEKVPKLLNDITEALFNPEKTEAFGAAVAKFYRSMIEAGMDEEKAFELTKKFMDSSSPGGMISQALGGMDLHGDGDELGRSIERKVKEGIASKLGADDE